uniref:hypothetical protein n=1 Tax=uncultured Caulobacter sp. TaxID=158749 RepID=UPI0025D3F48E|nr:hypothetical protein [uncultured Caulobacter sp.]
MRRAPNKTPGARFPSDHDLRLIALIEGQSKLSLKRLAFRLGVSFTSAWRVLERLRSEAVIREVSMVRRGLFSGAQECVVYLRCEASDRDLIADLEQRLVADPAVWTADSVAGAYDYRLSVFHPDILAAQAWYSQLLAHRSVLAGRLLLVRNLFEHCNFAAAILGSTLGACDAEPHPEQRPPRDAQGRLE